jgi:hypothetical protein
MPPPTSLGQAVSQRGSRREQAAAEIAAQLVTLDQRKVAVQLHIQGREQLVFGVGDYQLDPDLGGVLRVQEVGCANGAELLFLEDQWTGRIGSGHGLGCDFLIHVR